MVVTALLVLQTNIQRQLPSDDDVCDNPHIFVTDLIFQVGEDELHQDTESVMDAI